jgi:superfamily II DNA/RNA helicase
MNSLNFKDFNLSQDILESIEKLGYKNPSEVQEKVIPLILSDKDLVVKAQTGSGKTAAFAIPICEKIELQEKYPQVLILSPTRELALQIKDDFSNIGRFKRIRSAAIYGKEPISLQINTLNQRIHVVSGTPGRVMDHIERGTLSLEKIKYLVIDEADEMLNMGFIDQVTEIIKKLPTKRLTLLFSATIPTEILKLCDSYMNNPVSIDIQSKNSTADRIEQTYYEVLVNEKFNLLNKVIYTSLPESAIIFCRTKANVDSLVSEMKNEGYSCAALHGGMLQTERTEVINSFKRGDFMFLVATDVAARGIDVDNITHVINYDIPMEKESYVHRIGRTGRAGNTGFAITFVSPREYRFLKEIEEYFSFEINEGKTPSLEDVEKGKKLFAEKTKLKPKPKKSKSKELNKEITKIYIGAGKKKKIRPGDIAGTVSSIDGINPEDIGIIEIQDNFSYVDIFSGKGTLVLEALKHKTIKGKTVRVAIAKK